MNPLPADSAEFSALLQRLFAECLTQQKNVSPRTVTAYRDTFHPLLRYAESGRGKPPAKLTLNDFDAKLVLDFLDHLEAKRHNSVCSHNALGSRASLSQLRGIAMHASSATGPAILDIPMKRLDKPLLGLLARDEVQALLAAPDANTWCGRHDRILIALLYNSGARASELIGIRVTDVTLEAAPSVHLHGKGRKQQTVPLRKKTSVEIRH